VGAVNYIGRFAPSPTGPLHAGSLATALASWLDARAHQGQWLVRIEDVDTTRCLAGLDHIILQQLAACAMHSDTPVLYQSRRSATYQRALDTLISQQRAYPCGCTRKDIEAALALTGFSKQRHGELVYPGTCRAALHGKATRAWRFAIEKFITNNTLALIDKAQEAINTIVSEKPAAAQMHVFWRDRRLGKQQQDVVTEVGDFVLKRADGCFAYQLAVVVDDAAQGITDIVRGEDLADNTARQMLLQQALALPTPRYLHTPLVLGANHEKLSKQNGASAIDIRNAQTTLNQAAVFLGLSAHPGPTSDALLSWTRQWARLYPD